MADDLATVRLLRPIRVLVAGDDDLAVNRMCDELLWLGFQAMATTRRARIATLAAIERVNVVILEPSGGVRAAAAMAGALDELPHRVRVLLVCPRDSSAASLGYDVIEPGAPAEELAAAVHRAFRGGPAQAPRASRR